jgi:3-isopropylmalate/(R)-2-methylmalate dehydratase large subunit
MGRTFVEKVLAVKAGVADDEPIGPGQIVSVRPDHLLTHDNTSAIIGKISAELEEYGIVDPDLPIIVLDHIAPASSEKIATEHKKVREFVKKYGVKNFYDVGTGVCHQVVIEKRLAMPGMLVVGSDSHTCSYGAVGCFSTGVDRTESASLLLTGEMWLRVPGTIKVTVKGKLGPGVSAKDLVLSIVGDISSSGAAYSTLEFHGDIFNLNIADRITIANMGVEMDSKGCIFPVDELTLDYLGLEHKPMDYEYADPDAKYIKELFYDMSKVGPVVAKPHHVHNVVPVKEVAGTKLNQCFLGTCTNGRYEDLRKAADILKGKKVADSVRFLVCPASRAEFEKALADDTISILVEAGGMLLPTGCGPCLGAHQGVLAPGEVCLSTANRNFKGRMGCKEAFIYLSSPATVAASAIEGVIADPRKYI